MSDDLTVKIEAGKPVVRDGRGEMVDPMENVTAGLLHCSRALLEATVQFLWALDGDLLGELASMHERRVSEREAADALWLRITSLPGAPAEPKEDT